MRIPSKNNLKQYFYIIEGRLSLTFNISSNNLEQIESGILRETLNNELYSFDIFDTLIQRKIENARILKQITAKYVSQQLKKHGIDASPSKVLKLRIQIENDFEKHSEAGQQDTICKLEAIAERLIKSFACETILTVYDVVNFELETEKSVTTPTFGIKTLLNRLHERGKRIIAISETSYTEEQLSSLLEFHDLRKFISKIYSSSDTGYNKATGHLFQYVLREEGLLFTHIGDNYVLDYITPKKLGIKTFWFHDKKYFKRNRKLRQLHQRNNELEYLNACLEPFNYYSPSNLYRLGYNVIGPALTIYIHDLIGRLNKDRIDSIFFVARDGYILKIIYKIFSETIYKDAHLPPGKYLCISRKSIQSLTETSTDSTAQKFLLHGYLKLLGFFDGKTPALVDIKGEGLTQVNLANIFHKELESQKLHGYYFNLCNNGSNLDLESIHGLLSDWRKEKRKQFSLIDTFGTIIENITHPNHGVTWNYTMNKDGKFKPLFKKTSGENQYPLRSQILAGIVDYVKNYIEFYPIHQTPVDRLLKLETNAIAKWIAFPPKNDAKIISTIFAVNDYPQEKVYKIVKEIKWGDYFTPSKLINKTASSIWPQATLELSPFPLVVFVYHWMNTNKIAFHIAVKMRNMGIH